MQLEEVCKPQDILHEVYIVTLLVFIAAGPKHLPGIDEIEDNAESLCSWPQWEEYSDLLGVINVCDDISELLALVNKTIFKGEEFHILHDKADLVVVVVRVFLTIIFIYLFWLVVINEILHLIIIYTLIIQKVSHL